jgi:hypothetical protein
MLVKFGWRAGLVGMAVTVLGSWQLSLDANKNALLPQVIHSVGLIIMLGGCCVALIGYRLPWLIRVGNALSQIVLSDRAPIAGGGGTAESKPALRSVVVVALCAGPPLVMSFLLAMWVIPAWMAGLVIYVLNIGLTVTAVVTIASGSRWQRAFALGALIPLTFLIIELWFAPLFAVGRSGGFGGSYGESSFLVELRRVSMVLSYVGESRIGTVITWIAAAFTGMVAVAVRALLYRINQS